MDICSNELCFYVFIQLERTHEPVRPYIPIMVVLERKIVDGRSCSKVCRHARLVPPFKQSCVYAFDSAGADARAVRPYLQKRASVQSKIGKHSPYVGSMAFLSR